MINYGQMGATLTAAATDSASTVFTGDGPAVRKLHFLYTSDIVTHVQRDASDASDPGADSSTSPRIPANTVVQLTILGTEKLSVVRGDDEASDGTIWLTAVD